MLRYLSTINIMFSHGIFIYFLQLIVEDWYCNCVLFGGIV